MIFVRSSRPHPNRGGASPRIPSAGGSATTRLTACNAPMSDARIVVPVETTIAIALTWNVSAGK
jgi:hypothetical protein